MKRLAVITGASSGLGRDFAKFLHEYLHIDELVAVARRHDALKSLQEECKEFELTPFVADLSRMDEVQFLETWLSRRIESGDSLALMVNNAGFGTYGPFAETDLAWQVSMLELNIVALTRLSWFAARNLEPGGHLINVASIAGFMPLGNFAAYAASKAYVLSLSMAIRAELKEKKLHVCAVCPGPVKTEFSKVASGGAREEVLHGKPSELVVRHAYRSALRKKSIAIFGFSWKLQAFFSRIFGRNFIANFAWKHMRRPQANPKLE
jgi:short-subunit dehydrogenase